MKDFRGQEILPGDRVVYATHHGSQTNLTELEVTDVGPKSVRGLRVPIKLNDRIITLKNMHTVVKL